MVLCFGVTHAPLSDLSPISIDKPWDFDGFWCFVGALSGGRRHLGCPGRYSLSDLSLSDTEFHSVARECSY